MEDCEQRARKVGPAEILLVSELGGQLAEQLRRRERHARAEPEAFKEPSNLREVARLFSYRDTGRLLQMVQYRGHLGAAGITAHWVRRSEGIYTLARAIYYLGPRIPAVVQAAPRPGGQQLWLPTGFREESPWWWIHQPE